MTKQIAIIDPFIKSPAIHCFNHLISHFDLHATYHQPSIFGINTLRNQIKKNQAYIVLGSASHVHENLPWQMELAQFLKEELQKNIPVLGLCFGHQLMAHAFGAKVEFYFPDEKKFMGTREVVVTEDFWNYKRGEKFLLAVTHKQVVKDLPRELKAVGEGLPHDIIIHESLPFLGTQAHPEASTYFSTTDITNLSSQEIEAAQKDGTRFIERFFEYFNLL